MQRKAGILYGEDHFFAESLINYLNAQGISEFQAEPVKVGRIIHDELIDYALIMDLVSPRVPFYHSMLKYAALNETSVINNPFSISADDRFVASVVAEKILLNVPKTTLIPSHFRARGTVAETYINMELPWKWDQIFEEIGFPAILKPLKGGTAHDLHLVHDADELFEAHKILSDQPVILQSLIPAEEIYICFYIGNAAREVIAAPYEPARGKILEQDIETHPTLINTMKMHARALSEELGYDFCTTVFATYEEEPHIIDFCNPIPAIGEEYAEMNFYQQVVHGVGNLIIERIGEYSDVTYPLTWGTYIPEKGAPMGKATRSIEETTGTDHTAGMSEPREVVFERIKSQIHRIDYDRIGKAGIEEKDDLKLIKGIGPFIEEKLNAIEIYTFRQVANFSSEDEELINEIIEFFPGRVKRDRWVDQARELKQV